MNDADARDDLARLVPAAAERDLPGDRHLRIQEFLMSEIHRDLRPRPSARRPFLVTAALTAAAAVVAAVAVAVTGVPGDGPAPADRARPGTQTPAPAQTALTGPDILLAAATTARRQPADTGTYWHVTVESGDTKWENFYDRDGKAWIFAPKFGERPMAMTGWSGFSVGGPTMSVRQIQDLPTTADALKAFLTEAAANADLRNSGGPITPERRATWVFYGLISLVSTLPAPPPVRAAAFQAIATYPNVTNLGPVDGGTGLRITLFEGEVDHQGRDASTTVRLVVDPATSQVGRTTFVVTPEGALYLAGEGGSIALTAGWTDTMPA